MIIINLKNYKFGSQSLALAKQIQRYLQNSIICPSTADLSLISNKTKLKVYAQHIDFQDTNRATGFILPQSIKKSGASGTLLNHAEHRISLKKIKESIKKCKELNLKTIVCTDSLSELKKIIKFKPTAIAFEDSKLISTGKSITQYNPESIRKFIKTIKHTSIIPICGAGISTPVDVKEAYKLGCKGVLIASAITNSKNPTSLLKQIVSINKK